MIPLDEMFMRAQNGAVIDMVSRQFDLTRDQTVAALEALLPAFSQGLKRTAATPQGIAPFLQALASGNHAKYMEDMSRAFAPAGMADGNGILGHIFGSKEVSRAVAEHAARATGIGQDILRQMLPAIASMMMGGLYQQSTGRMNAASGGGFGGGGNIIGEVIEQMMRQGQSMGGAYRPENRRTESGRQSGSQAGIPNPFDNPFGKILQDMFGGNRSGVQTGTTSGGERENAGAENPLGRIFEDMLSAGMGMNRAGRTSASETAPEKPAAESRQTNPYDEFFGQMFETGRKARDDYQKGVETIFDQFLKGMERYR